MSERPFSFLDLDPRGGKPRSRGLTEIRGPHETPVGKHYLQDLLEAYGEYVDSLEFAGGSFALMARPVLREHIELAHDHDVLVSTGGFLERVLLQGSAAVDRYIDECRELGFDVLEISPGFIDLATDDWLRLIGKVHAAGLRARPVLDVGAAGGSPLDDFLPDATGDPERLAALASRLVEAGAELLMIKTEAGAEEAGGRLDAVPAELVEALGVEKLIFRAADAEAAAAHVARYGAEVNLSIGAAEIVRLEALRCGLARPQGLWGRPLA